MVSQLRMYQVREGQLEAFIREWRAGVVPLRRRFGFKVEGAWTVPSRNEFVWIISYDGPEGFEARDAAYYASPDRKALTPDPARHLAHVDTRLMTSVKP